MFSRRDFIMHAARGLATTAVMSTSVAARSPALYRERVRAKTIELRDETIKRYSFMNGDNWHMSWAGNNLQYASMCDGYGNFERPRGQYNSRLMAVDGCPDNATFHDVPGYPALTPTLFDNRPRYYNLGVIAIGRRMYQWLSTWSVPYSNNVNGLRFIGVKLIYTNDNGLTWYNQDGSTPVRWEDWGDRSRGNTMLFYEEPQDTFSMLSVLQMGKGYSDNRDGYVYIYSPNGNVEGTMNELVLARVRKGEVLDRKKYEFFSGMEPRGGAKWTRRIGDRRVVQTFPSGWVNVKAHPWAWVPSVTYNAALDIYMMANWATAPGRPPESEWFTKPSYLGFWVAQRPWGPWAQIHETASWTPGGDLAARCYSPIIAPKWIAPDGKSFWLVWTDFQQMMSTNELARRREEIARLPATEHDAAEATLARMNRPYYSFNVQRVDLHVS